MPTRTFGVLVVVACALAGAGCGAAPPPASSPSPVSATSDVAPAVVEARPAGPPVRVDCGDFTTCAIATGGAVHCWGHDKAGELGDGGGADKVKAVAVRGIEGATSIAMASQFACALLADKTVRCWGSGRIANDGKVLVKSKPVAVASAVGVEEIAASGAIACARTEAAILCWGADPSTIGTPPPGAFVRIAAGFTHGCALDKKGAVTCWGTGDWGPKGAFAKPSVAGALSIVTGDRHACVITKDKHVQCWGQNDAGQLGTKTDVDMHKSPVAVPGVAGVVSLVAGESSTCALLGDGSTKCWGSNGDGELGLGKKSSDERPTKAASLTEASQLCIGSSHSCALTRSANLLCWGANAAGQLGDGTHDKRLAPTRVVW